MITDGLLHANFFMVLLGFSFVYLAKNYGKLFFPFLHSSYQKFHLLFHL